ncbi:Uncharacterised protein [Mycobacteroides abscessus subsp. abscessus]|nr:Uncharacterised protein [Mycobacteroides abscessus subsp. abscessus]
MHVRQVPDALDRSQIVAAQHHQQLLAVGDLAQERLGALGRGLLSGNQFGDGVDPAVASPVGQRTAQGGGDHLLGGPLAVVTRLRAVDDATTGELRCAGRALAGASGSLLPVRLLATTGHQATRLGGVGALTACGQLSGHHLVQQRDVGWGVEQFGRQLDGAVRLAARSLDCDLQKILRHYFSPRLTAVRTTTKPPLRPGMAPLISSTPFSASTLCTTRF